MEKSFDFGRLLKNHEKKHKSKPAQFSSVAGGVQKRLESNLKYRKSSRLSVFDKIRNLSRCESPVPVPDPQSKVEHRRQQLEKWKEEKEKRKKEAAAQKKKPFVAGVAHAPLKFVPPPPPPKLMPSTSGRVTRSQSARQQNISKQKVDTKQPKAAQSFAPKNASFQPPQIKNLTEVPTLAPINKNNKNKNKVIYKFDPVLPTNNQKQVAAKHTRTKASNKPMEARTTRNAIKEMEIKAKGRVTKKPSPHKNKRLSKTLQSSSSSEIDSSKTSSSEISEIDTASSLEKSPVFKKTPRKSLGKESKMFTPTRPIPKSESSSEEKLRSPKSPIEVPMTPEQQQIVEEAKKISPCVTMSRGKDNARKEMKKKMEEGLLDDDASDIENVDHFRNQLNSEIKRMTEMCEIWDKIMEQTTLSESVLELVLTAVGQARLLMSQKLQQFSSLVERCARPQPGAALVTPADLHGFWDMVFMQVENIDMRFKKLEELRARNWVEEAPVCAQPKLVRNNGRRAAKPSGASRIKEMIAAARKAKKEQESSSPQVLEPSAENKTFEAGFFSVRSPVRSPRGSTPATPVNKSLLKAVLSSEAKKASANKNTSSFAMLRASILSKNVEHDGIAPLPQTPVSEVNLYATPGRSILKSTTVASEKKTAKKSIKVVLFDDSDNDIQEQTSQEEKSVIDDVTEVKGVNKLTELNTDSGMSSMDIEKETDQKENKENSRRKGKLVRQDATTEDTASVMTRSRRKSMNVNLEESNEVIEEKTPRRSSRKKKALQETEINIVEEKSVATPKRSVRSRKSTGLSVMA